LAAPNIIVIISIIVDIITAIDGFWPNLYDAARVACRYAHHDVAEPYVVGITRRAAADAHGQAHAHIAERVLHVRRHGGCRRGALRTDRQARNDNVVPADGAKEVCIAVSVAAPLRYAVGYVKHGADGDQLRLLNADEANRVLGEL
jgi:hypothetical protein